MVDVNLLTIKQILGVIILCMELCLSKQQTTTLEIGVIADGCLKNGYKVNQTLTSTSVWDEHLEIRLHWSYLDSRDIYHLLRTVMEFRSSGMDAILLADDLQYLGGLSNELIKGDVPVIALGSVNTISAANADINENCQSLFLTPVTSKQQGECLPPFPSEEHMSTINNNHSLSYLDSNIVSVLHHLKWSDQIILYDKGIDLYVDRIIQILSFEGRFVITYEVSDMDVDQIHRLLQTLDGPNGDDKINITVIGYQKCVEKVLFTAGQYVANNKRKSSLSLRSLWMVFLLKDDPNMDKIQKYTENIDNVAVLRLPTFFVGNNNNGTTDVLQLVRKALFNIGSNATMTTTNKSEMNNLIIDFLQSELQRCHWSPVQTLMFTLGGRGWSHVGYVDTMGQTAFYAEIFPNTRFGFNRRKFSVSTLEWEPFVIASENNTYSGLCFDLLDHLATSLNFTFEVDGPPDGQWGVINSNGTWTGMVGQLAKREIDIVAAPLSTQAKREEVMDFTYSFYIDYTTILMKKKDPNITKWRTLIDPFSEELLLCVCISLPVVSLLLFLFERFSPYYVGDDEGEGKSGLHTYQDAFWYMYGALLTQGGEHLPRSQTGRTLLSSWWLFCIIMMATYSGNLIAFLTVSKDKPPFSTVAGMLQQENYRWGTIGGSSWITAFNETRAPDLMRVWAKMQEFNASDNSILSSKSSEHFTKVLGGGYSYIGDKTQMEIKMAEECSLLISDDEFMPLQYAFGLPNFSPYTKMFSDELLHIHESGLLHIWKSRLWPQRNFCNGELVTSAKTIALIDVQSAFYLIGIGLALATLMIIAENVAFWYKQSKKSKGDIDKESTITGASVHCILPKPQHPIP
ncbi:glutamate receptor ionotropic, kainate 2-like [Ylistrum balloti]|uniref:glutamate receptor ionotropic, kainate 2-like n=1 Tax=Ylistrum balloti TaxID=509963 RepID=UPI002905A54C|nr:glutamate receptor ionotropic, kainate 2-like [Ylistrum balloti]